jgi:peptidyl-prolyl cis-trans isomerase A (cyclophilin A)
MAYGPGKMRSLLALLLLSLPLPASLSAQDVSPKAVAPMVLIEVRTELGDFRMELYPQKAPNTVANFLRYVDGGFFDGGSFHRTVHAENQPTDSIRIAVIQGDISRERRRDGFGSIGLERTNETGLKHLDGTVSMARGGPDTASSSFFVSLGDQPELDLGGARNPDGQGFAAFGSVVEGMDVIQAINASPAEGQTLQPAIRILEVRRVGS